jgi:hypothetical protein
MAAPGRAGLVVEPAGVTPETDGRMRSPTFSLTTEEAQKLMDNLWHLGLRPSEGTGSAGALAATQRHLEDLKTVAFHALKIPKNS